MGNRDTDPAHDALMHMPPLGELIHALIWGRYAATLSGTIHQPRPDERPTLRDDAGRVRAVVDAWRP